MDALLEWMSFRGSGGVSDIPPDLVGEGSVRRVVEGLSVLGHVEFVKPNTWQIAPPVLAGLPASGNLQGEAVLCGARTAGVLSRLRVACGHHGAAISLSPVAHGPSVIRVSSSRCCVLNAAANEAGLGFQRDAAFTLLACTPAILEWPRTPCPMVSGRVETVRRFSRSKLEWIGSTLDDARKSQRGFFRIKRDWDWVSIIKMGTEESAYIDDRAGRLLVATKLKAVSWDPEERVLSVPRQLYPPRVIARALAMCAGTPPYFDQTSKQVSFASVPSEIVRLALGITGLRLS